MQPLGEFLLSLLHCNPTDEARQLHSVLEGLTPLPHLPGQPLPQFEQHADRCVHGQIEHAPEWPFVAHTGSRQLANSGQSSSPTGHTGMF